MHTPLTDDDNICLIITMHTPLTDDDSICLTITMHTIDR